MKYTVIAFYPNLGIKVRITKYDTESEMYEYISGLRICDTPYVAFNDKGMIDIMETGEANRIVMMNMINDSIMDERTKDQ